MKEKYTGILDYKKMAEEERKAYITFHNITYRTKKFRWNKPDFTVREFIHWLVKEKKRLKLKRPSLSRFDHSKGYTWANFILEELVDNCKESAQRNDFKKHNYPKQRPIEIYDLKDGSTLMTCPSMRHAAAATGVDPKLVKLYAAKILKRPKKFGYRFVGDKNV